MESILEVRKLSKSFPVNKTETQKILQNIDLSIKRGEFTAVMGPSGSGKSTLLYNISGMDTPTSGSAVLMEHPLQSLSDEQLSALRLNSLGFVFQQHNLLKNLTIFDNIVLPGYKAKRESRKIIDRRAKDLMEHLDISELADKDITQASGGQLQRASICRALINTPDFLFGDEPTGALNSKAAGEVLNILEEINKKGTTVLLVTHDARVAARADRVLYMMDGAIKDEIELNDTVSSGESKETRLLEWLKTQGF